MQIFVYKIYIVDLNSTHMFDLSTYVDFINI